jgi:uroporphyrinogen-III synthase
MSVQIATPDTGSLTGFRIGVTSDRRSSDLIEALERRGATVMHAPALKIAPVEQDRQLLQDTAEVLAARPDISVITTAYGMRRWFEAADAAGVGEELTDALEGSRIYVRGPKARGAVRAAGLDDVGISHDERTATVVDMLLEEGVGGSTIAVQQHGYSDACQLERLRGAGATVLTVTPYRWIKPEGAEDKVPRLIEAVCGRRLDVVTFTSAPAVDALWSTAHEMGLHEELA